MGKKISGQIPFMGTYGFKLLSIVASCILLVGGVLPPTTSVSLGRCVSLWRNNPLRKRTQNRSRLRSPAGVCYYDDR
jgi:hypothetical protein